ncbi:class I alpha-mannosidase 1A [Myxozyma melibiosi]|uniref:alpha-1,2-Mannosidase n=1 Tax=Myxozyma melibiosi TaxID=54550 RepID=A0ABR1F3W9_9ASCO
MPSVRLRRHRAVLLFTLFALAISYHFVVVRRDYSIVPDKFLYGLPSSSSSSSSSILKTAEDADVADADQHSVLPTPPPSSTTSSSSSSSTTTSSSSHNSDPLPLAQSPNTKLVSSLETILFAGTFPVDDYYTGPSSNVLPPGIRQSSSDPSIFSRPRIAKFPFANPAALPDEPPLSFAKIQGSFAAESDDERQKREARLAAVKDAFLHSWQGYKEYAWGHDEVQPASNTSADTFGGLGASIVDALDTLQIMDLTEEFEEAKAFVAALNFTTSNYKTIPIFETTIRFLGGLISAYDLSSPREEIFLDKAVELADLMLGAFDTPNGMPVLYYNPVLAHYGPEEAKLRAGNTVVFAQFSSLSLEFTRLAQITKNNAYYAVIQRISDQLQESQKKTDIPGLWPSFMDISGCVTASEKKSSAPSAADNQDVEAAALNRAAIDAETKQSDSNAKQKRQVPAALRKSLLDVPRPGSSSLSPVNLPVEECVGVKAIVGTVKEDSNNKLKYTAGGLADSAYEYMIKEYLLLGGTVAQYKDMYQSATAAIDDNLLFRPKVAGDPDILFSGNVLVDKDTKAAEFDAEMTHLTCYIGGMYAIGARALENPAHLQTAEKLTEGCYWSYRATNTGIMPENFHVDPCLSSDCHFVDRFASSEGENKLRKRQVDETTHQPQARNPPAPTTPSRPPASTTPLPATKTQMPCRLPTTKTKSEPSTTVPGTVLEVDAPDAPAEDDPNRWETGGWYDQPHSILYQDGRYLLRPEALESIFVMYRVTGDRKWQDRGWEMFSAIVKYTKTDAAFSAIKDVTNNRKITYLDEMESFWMAETLKYAYLLFAEPSLISLDDYVFNTEAHPLLRPSPVQSAPEK